MNYSFYIYNPHFRIISSASSSAESATSRQNCRSSNPFFWLLCCCTAAAATIHNTLLRAPSSFSTLYSFYTSNTPTTQPYGPVCCVMQERSASSAVQVRSRVDTKLNPNSHTAVKRYIFPFLYITFRLLIILPFAPEYYYYLFNFYYCRAAVKNLL